jgi:hypothetical protein
MVGVGKTVKLEPVNVSPLDSTVMFPVPDPTGTVVVIEVALDAEMDAVVLLNLTTGLPSKLVPVIITVAPTAPLVGVKFEMVGVGKTVKLEPVNVSPLDSTVMFPVPAPTGTVVVMEVASDDVIEAVVPLNFTTGLPSKLVPEIITVAPTAPLVGVKFEMVGVERTVKLVRDVPVSIPTVTEIVPVLAPDGTVVVILVGVASETTAAVPLNETMLLSGVASKFVPVIITAAPTAADVGVNDVISGTCALTWKCAAMKSSVVKAFKKNFLCKNNFITSL